MSALTGVKVGDRIKCSEWHERIHTLYEVERITKTRAVCKGGASFAIDDGLKIGTGSRRFHRTYGRLASQSDIEVIVLEVRVRAAQNSLKLFRVSYSTLEAVEALLLLDQKA